MLWPSSELTHTTVAHAVTRNVSYVLLFTSGTSPCIGRGLRRAHGSFSSLVSLAQCTAYVMCKEQWLKCATPSLRWYITAPVSFSQDLIGRKDTSDPRLEIRHSWSWWLGMFCGMSEDCEALCPGASSIVQSRLTGAREFFYGASCVMLGYQWCGHCHEDRGERIVIRLEHSFGFVQPDTFWVAFNYCIHGLM